MMRYYSPTRIAASALAALTFAGATFLMPAVASADGGATPRPQAPAIHGTATYGDAGEQTYVVGAQPAGLVATTYGRGNVQGITATDLAGSWPTVAAAPASPR